MDGIINIRKEKGYTSHDVVAKLRGILHQKKIGHTGTLDPEAEGVLPVCLGRGTRLCEMLTGEKKTYEAVLLLGVSTDTQDMTGTILSQYPVKISQEELERAVQSFLGEQQQLPPMYSAVKINGKRLYELARKGVEIERTPRPVIFYQLEILDISLPVVKLRVECSKGAYIRTLCHDLGQKLGCGGAMQALVRTKVGRFEWKDSLTLSAVEELYKKDALTEHLWSVEQVLDGLPLCRCLLKGDKLLHNGNPLPTELVGSPLFKGRVRMYDSGGSFIGVFCYQEEKGRYIPVKMFI